VLKMFKSIKKLSCIAICSMAIATTVVHAQTAAPEAQLEVYQAENPGWLVNLDEAYEQSKKTGKPIMANFTGSDWCGWCKKLTASVFSTPEFKAWAEKNVVLLELDFPRRKSLPENIRIQNSNLQQAFQVGGYPTVWVFDLDKNAELNNYNVSALGKTGYQPGPAEFTSGVDQMLAQRKK
jgi:thiol:disulfide interchange protein